MGIVLAKDNATCNSNAPHQFNISAKARREQEKPQAETQVKPFTVGRFLFGKAVAIQLGITFKTALEWCLYYRYSCRASSTGLMRLDETLFEVQTRFEAFFEG